MGGSLRAVLFDMDGTLVDTEPYWIEAEYRLVAEFGGTWSDEHAHDLVGNALIASASTCATSAGCELDPPVIVERLLDDVVASVGRADAVAAGRASSCWPTVRERGRAVRDGDDVVRAAGRDRRATAPDGHFATVVTGDEVSDGKPHPEAYLTAVRAAGRRAAPGCVAIEDSPTGVASAAGGRVRRCSPCRTTSPIEPAPG